jgi:integrase/recombinase XerD
MLGIFRRHQKRCDHRKEGRKYRRCHCPVWVDGSLNGVEIHKSLRTRDWQKAQGIVREWEAEDRQTSLAERQTIQTAFTEFLADIEARQLHGSTVRKYKLLERQLKAFAQDRGFRFLNELDLTAVGQFRSQWKDGPRSSAKKLERLRAFFRFAEKRKWVSDNPASELKSPKISLCPTLPYGREEMVKIIAGADLYSDAMPSTGKDNARRIRALILLLRYRGMRIGDAVNLTADRIKGNRLFLYTQKTGVPVNAILPDFVLTVR